MRRWWSGLLALVALWWLLTTLPVGAQQRPVPQLLSRRASAVVVDGRPLFDVRDSGNLTGVERADTVNRLLAEEIRRRQTNPQRVSAVTIVPDPTTGQITLRLNDQHLLTVTSADLGGRAQSPGAGGNLETGD
jgi:hypothetical protein